MTSSTFSLKELHQVHQQLEAAREALRKGPIQIKVREGIVKKKEQELVDFQTELKQKKMTADSKSLELKTVEKKLEDLQGKLNSASSNREFDIIKEQIAADQMAKSVLEDEILESFDQLEAEAERQPEIEKKIESAKSDLKDFEAKFQEDSAKLQATIERLEVELKELEKHLPTEPGDRYRRLVKTRGAKALGPVINGACGNCYVNLTAQQRIQIKSGPIQFCSSCATMLYSDESEEKA